MDLLGISAGRRAHAGAAFKKQKLPEGSDGGRGSGEWEVPSWRDVTERYLLKDCLDDAFWTPGGERKTNSHPGPASSHP